MKLSFYLPLYKVVKQGFLLLLLLRGAGEEVFIFFLLLFITDRTHQPFYAFTMDHNRTKRIFCIQAESHFLIP